MTARCGCVVEDLAGVIGVYGVVKGAIGAFLVSGDMMVGATVVTNFNIVGGAEAMGVACGAAVAVGGMMGVAKFA